MPPKRPGRAGSGLLLLWPVLVNGRARSAWGGLRTGGCGCAHKRLAAKRTSAAQPGGFRGFGHSKQEGTAADQQCGQKHATFHDISGKRGEGRLWAAAE